MEWLRQYVISVTTAAIVCGIVTSLLKSSSVKEVVKLICGVFLAYTVLAPITGMDFSDLAAFYPSYSQDAGEASALGEDLARETKADIIKRETEAYILDKAKELKLELTVDVSLDENQIPVSVRLSGEASPYARTKLQQIIANDLEIAKENQQWTG